MSRDELNRVFGNMDNAGAKKRASAKLQGERDWKSGTFVCKYKSPDLRAEWAKGFKSAAAFNQTRLKKMETALEAALRIIRDTDGEDDLCRTFVREVEKLITDSLGH